MKPGTDSQSWNLGFICPQNGPLCAGLAGPGEANTWALVETGSAPQLFSPRVVVSAVDIGTALHVRNYNTDWLHGCPAAQCPSVAVAIGQACAL